MLQAIWLAGLVAAAPLSAMAEPLRVFAAASLTEAMEEVLSLCAAQSGQAAIGVYAGSGTIARQIDRGAPADLVISANPDWMDWLAARGLIVPETRQDLLSNALVLLSTRAGDTEGDWRSVLGAAAGDGIAVADLVSVPAGIYARQALEAAGMLDSVRLVQASNVREALTWVVRGELSLGIVYRSDAAAWGEGRVFPIEPATHDPIRYPAALLSDTAGPEARALLACIAADEAAITFERHGFTRLE